MSTTNENGLGLFDDTASAVGNFPSALRGYDRSAVDDYVRSLEGAVVQLRRRAGDLDRQRRAVQDELTEVKERQQAAEIDFTNLGGRASDILRLAEEQARDVREQAEVEADKLREEARRQADRTRDEAERVGGEITARGIAEIEQLRARGQEELQALMVKAQAEAEHIVAAARREAEALQRAAEHEAQTVRQNAYLDTEALKRTVEVEVTEIRRNVAGEREAALNHLRQVHDESVQRTSALLAEANEHHHQATQRLDADIAEAARIRAEALAEAERVKLSAAKEAEDRIVAARKQAAAITDRTQQEFAWRKQQLRRETDLLGQRKQAVLNQLASLSALAEQSVDSFPDLEDLDGYDQDQNDRTVMLPAALAPSMPRQGSPRRQDDSPATAPAAGTPAGPQGGGQEADQANGQGGRLEQSAKVDQSQQSQQGDSDDEQDDATEETIAIDGDVTLVVPSSQLPPGPSQPRDAAEKKG